MSDDDVELLRLIYLFIIVCCLCYAAYGVLDLWTNRSRKDKP